MGSTAVASNTIVLEVLDQDNYEYWSSCVKTYLVAKDLWEVVDTAETPAEPKDGESDDEYKVWIKRNAKALHAIKVCCGTEMFSMIIEASTAKIAWDKLKEYYNSRKLRSEVDEEEEMWTRNVGEESEAEATEGEENSFSWYETFSKLVGAGEWDKANEYLETTLRDNPDALRARHPKSGCTALQFAAKKGRLDIVKKLVDLVPRMMSEEDMEIPDDEGYTALHEAVDRQNLDIVKELLLKMRKEGVAVTNEKNATALHTAAKLGNVEIVKELVAKMHTKDLEITNKRGFTALGYAFLARNVGEEKCSEADMIKMAKIMVERNKEILTIPLPPNKLIPVVELFDNEFKRDVVRYLCSVMLGSLMCVELQTRVGGCTSLIESSDKFC